MPRPRRSTAEQADSRLPDDQEIHLAGRNSKEERDRNVREDEQPDRPFSISVIDLKSEPCLLHGAKTKARRVGPPFKWFTNVRENATAAFDLLLLARIKNTLIASQRTEVLIPALGFQYGEFYGAGYFSSIDQTVLRRYLNHFGDEIDSFEALKDRTASHGAHAIIETDNLLSAVLLSRDFLRPAGRSGLWDS